MKLYVPVSRPIRRWLNAFSLNTDNAVTEDQGQLIIDTDKIAVNSSSDFIELSQMMDEAVKKFGAELKNE